MIEMLVYVGFGKRFTCDHILRVAWLSTRHLQRACRLGSVEPVVKLLNKFHSAVAEYASDSTNFTIDDTMDGQTTALPPKKTREVLRF